MKCLKPYFDKKSGRQFNCGRCHACRVNITSAWTLRCLYELDSWKDIGASFVTLTYDDEHLPHNFGLQKEDLQKFFKRLRINLNRFYQTDYPILYRACGEYGDSEKKYIGSNGVALGRPHYHAIIYGLDDLNENHRNILKKSWDKCDPYMFDKKIDSGMQEVTREDIAYVCGYVQKKLNGQIADEVYGDRLPPFSLTSQKLGLNFALNNQYVFNRGFTTLNGQKIAIPRYFREKLGIVQSDLIRSDYSSERDSVCFKAFQDHLNDLGLSWLLEDPIANHSAIERRWYRWHELYEEKYLELVESEYMRKRLIRGKSKI